MKHPYGGAKRAGLVAVIEAAAGTWDFRLVDYKGETLRW